MVRMGLMALASTSSHLRFNWIESGNLSDALETYRCGIGIDLVLLDLNLPDSQGLQGVRRFLGDFPQARLAVFSATEDEFVIRQALALGAVGFVPKSSSANATLRLLETILHGSRSPAGTHSAEVHSHLASANNTGPAALASVSGSAYGDGLCLDARTHALNPTQLKVLELVLAGMSNQEIAVASNLALGTVKNTVSAILLSLDVHSRSHLISVFR